MSDVLDISARRWASHPDTSMHAPVAALREAIRQIEAGEMHADHVVVAIGSIEDGAAVTDWLQAGSFDVFAQRGLMAGVQMAMFEAGAA